MIYSQSSINQTVYKIYKYAYDKGVNAALLAAEDSKVYKIFKKDVEKAIFQQIVFILVEKNYFDTLMSLVGKSESFLETQIRSLLTYVALDKLVDFKSFLVWAGERGGQSFLDKSEINAVFGLKNQQVINYFDDYSKLLINSVDDYTKRWLAKEIQNGLKEGLTPFEIQERITRRGREFSAIRAERITLTETARAMTTVEIEAASRAGVTEMVWQTSQDERVCPICGPLDGKQTRIGGSFPGGYAQPPAHVSCRCYIKEILPRNYERSATIWLGA